MYMVITFTTAYLCIYNRESDNCTYFVIFTLLVYLAKANKNVLKMSVNLYALERDGGDSNLGHFDHESGALTTQLSPLP